MTSDNREVDCEGWWQQEGFGRQPMNDLRLKFDDFRIFGFGYDIVGAFTLTGGVTPDGHVMLAKEYPTHSVFYSGTYDGEGCFYGEWFIGALRDRWFIRVKSRKGPAGEDAGIREIE